MTITDTTPKPLSARLARVNVEEAALAKIRREGMSLSATAAVTGMSYDNAKEAFDSGMAKVTKLFLDSAMGDFRPGVVKRKKAQEEAAYQIAKKRYEMFTALVDLFAEAFDEQVVRAPGYEHMPQGFRDAVSDVLDWMKRAGEEAVAGAGRELVRKGEDE